MPPGLLSDEAPRRSTRFPSASEDLWYNRSNKKLRRKRLIDNIKKLSCPVTCLESKHNETMDVQTSSDSHINDASQDHLDRVTTEASRRGLLGRLDEQHEKDASSISSAFDFSKISPREKSLMDILRSPTNIFFSKSSSSSIDWDPPFPDPETCVEEIEPSPNSSMEGGQSSAADEIVTSTSFLLEEDKDHRDLNLSDLSHDEEKKTNSPFDPFHDDDDAIGATERTRNTMHFENDSNKMLRRHGSRGDIHLPLSASFDAEESLSSQSRESFSSHSTVKMGANKTAEMTNLLDPLEQEEDTRISPAHAEWIEFSQDTDEPIKKTDSFTTQDEGPEPSHEIVPKEEPEDPVLLNTSFESLPDENGDFKELQDIPKFVSVPFASSSSKKKSGGKFSPLPCICGRQHECAGISAAFYMLSDPRSGYTKVPKEVNKIDSHYDFVMNGLRECFLRTFEDAKGSDDEERLYVANHHFDPHLVCWSSVSGRAEIPIFVSRSKMAMLEMGLTDDYRVTDRLHNPTDGYYVVPNYPNDRTKDDLKRLVKVHRMVIERKASKRLKKKKNKSKKNLDQDEAKPVNEVEVKRPSADDQNVIKESPEAVSLQKPASPDQIQSPPPRDQDVSGSFPAPTPSRIDMLRQNKRASLEKLNTLSYLLRTKESSNRKTIQASFNLNGRDARPDGASSPNSAETGAGEATKEDVANRSGEFGEGHAAASASSLSMPPSPAFANLDSNDREAMHSTLSEFEARRRSTVATKMVATCVKWRALLDTFESGLNQTASAEHWVYEASNATQGIVQDTMMSEQTSNGEYLGVGGADQRGNSASDDLPVFSGYVSSCIAEELSRARPELEANVNDNEQVGKSIIGELESIEARVIEAWDAYDAVASAGVTDGDTQSSAFRVDGSQSSNDLWAVQMRYRVSVANQSLAWKMNSTKLTKLFESVNKSERDRRVWLKGLLVEVVSRTPHCVATQTPMDKIKVIVAEIEEAEAELPITLEGVDEEIELISHFSLD